MIHHVAMFLAYPVCMQQNVIIYINSNNHQHHLWITYQHKVHPIRLSMTIHVDPGKEKPIPKLQTPRSHVAPLKPSANERA